jgi:hypothetical protein
MYDFYCNPEFDRIIAKARAERRDAIRGMFARLTRRSGAAAGRVAAS